MDRWVVILKEGFGTMDIIHNHPLLLIVILFCLVLVVLCMVAVRYFKIRKNNMELLKKYDSADLKCRRLQTAMQYIPYEVMQYNLMSQKLEEIDKKTGAVRELTYDEKQREYYLNSGRTVYPSLGRVTATIKQRFSQGEDTVEAILEGYCGSNTKYGKFTARAVYNSYGSPIEAICIIEDVTAIELEKKKNERKLEQVKNESMKDPLTGLYNKDGFFREGQHILDEHEGMNASLIFMDLDNFKSLNDTLGHMTGDRALRDVASKLREIFPERDIMARFGGDEFCVLTFDNTVSGLRDRLDTMIMRMQESYSDERNAVSVSASAGIAQIPLFGKDIKKVIVFSDKALYCAKERGKNRFVIYEKGMEPEGYIGREE